MKEIEKEVEEIVNRHFDLKTNPTKELCAYFKKNAPRIFGIMGAKANLKKYGKKGLGHRTKSYERAINRAK